uniref:TLC domain-containing protein n=1 Tax=Ditylenchus dipsaci TaxID=166011 RepID=A0A915CRY2_9BILA
MFFKNLVSVVLGNLVQKEIVLSLVIFRALQFAVRWYLFGKCTFRTFSYFKFVHRRHKRRPLPDSQSLQVVPPNKKWRISNEVVSLIHSVVSGLWALYACLMFPKLITNMDSYVDEVPKSLVYLSFGYLLHDLIDLLINERSVRIIELLFHHAVVITAFLVTLTTHLFLGLVMFGLLMELNSIFLHTRSLLNLYGQPKNSTAFKFVALLNIATFMVFRMSVSAYLLYWQLTNALSMKWYLALITFVVIASLAITNTVLCYRVMAADGLLGKKHQGTKRPAAAADTSTLRPIDEDEEINSDDEDDDSYSSDGNDATDLENGTATRPPRRSKTRGTVGTTVDECVGTELPEGSNGWQPMAV